MSFNSLIFILYFLPLTLLIYYVSNEKYRNLILLLASTIFFLWSSSQSFIVILISIAINYLLGYLLFKSEKYRKAILIFGLIFNIFLLMYYKYSNFFITNFNTYLKTNISLLNLIVPLGISYITFQQISFIVDIYKDKTSFKNNLIDYCLYILFFPKLIAGPITKYSQINDSLINRKYSDNTFNKGIYRFSIGLGKKIIISSTLETVANNIFSLSPSSLGFNLSWLGMITYTLQIYFDFSGYSDMAIGLANMFSISLPENFNKPYQAKGFKDFWKRWHISLSSFLRDYIYIPLGGNRVSKKRMLLNSFIVFLISGFWHGANFTFITWGIYHGLFVIIENIGFSKIYSKLPSMVSKVITFILISIGWVFFRSENLSYAFKFIKELFNFNNIASLNIINVDFKFLFIFILALILIFLPKIDINKNKILFLLSRIFSLIILIYSISIITTGSFMPFIYLSF